MELKDIYQDINWKSLIIGAAVFAFIVVFAMDNTPNLDWLLIFSSAGLLYIGYAAKNRLQGIILGAVGTIPLFLVTIFTNRLGVPTGQNLEFWILLSFLAIGAFCGFTGNYFSVSRKKAIAEKERRESIGKGKKKKKQDENKAKN